MGAQHRVSRRGHLGVTAAAVLLALGGVTAVGVGLWGNPPPPQPAAAASVPAPSGTSSPSTPSVTPSHSPSPSATSVPDPTPTPAPTIGPILAASVPTHLTIPAIGVDSSLMKLGLNADGSVQVPPVQSFAPAGWYENSPTPGQLGPSVMLGHVDAYNGRAVFYRLGEMKSGDQVSVTRSDNTVAVFTVDTVASYPKSNFPQLQVYGNTNRAELRLITCGGTFDKSSGHYLNNIVVYAHLTSERPA